MLHVNCLLNFLTILPKGVRKPCALACRVARRLCNFRACVSACLLSAFVVYNIVTIVDGLLGLTGGWLPWEVVSDTGGFPSQSVFKPRAFLESLPDRHTCDHVQALQTFEAQHYVFASGKAEAHWDSSRGRCDCSRREPGCEPPENGSPDPLPSIAFVTALLDIGRRGRSYCTYLQFMMPLLATDIDLVIYIERKGAPFVEHVRAHFGHAHRTRIIPIDGYADVHFHDLLPAMRAGIARSTHRHWARWFHQHHLSWLGAWRGTCHSNHHQETQIAEYGWVNHAKVGWVYDAIARREFGAEFFMWIDAGAGHGTNGLYAKHWCPCTLAVRGKVTLVRNKNAPAVSKRAFLRPGALDFYMHEGFLCEHLENIVGTMWGGDAESLISLYKLYNETLRAVTARGIADDDQPLLEMCLAQNRSLFQVLEGGFYSMRDFC